MTTITKFGILGCARIARRGMIEGIQQSGVAELSAIASRDAEKARSWAAEFGIPRHYNSYEALLADPEIEAVYIPLPNELHREWSLKAAVAGKHVLCEKPLGLDAEDAQAIVEGCHEAGAVVMEAFMWRHHPRVAHALRLIADGAIGELRMVKMDFSFDIDRRDWRLDSRRGGGAMYDLGCYGINAARLFTGEEPQEVHARARFHDTGVDMTAAISLRFPGGVLALLDCSFECPDRNRIEVVGTAGSIEFPGGVLPPEESQLILRRGAETEVISIGASQQYAEQVRAFCTAVSSGELRQPAEDGLANMKVLDAALRSARAAAGL
jgi:predicted dehydrogenase